MQPNAWPFRAVEALDAGAITFRELRRFHEAVYPGIWIPRGVELSAVERARAAWLWSGRRGVLAGLSASAVLGSEYVEGHEPAELVHVNQRPPQLISASASRLLDEEIQECRGMLVTTPARTAFDLARRLPLIEGVQRVDALMRATKVKVEAVHAVALAHPGARGLRQFRQTMPLVDGGAESPYESLMRIMLIQAGFPRPATQVEVVDESGHVVASIDAGWEEFKVGADFEGVVHWTNPKRRTGDIERYHRIPELGWIDIRTTSGMLHRQPQVFLDRVGRALISRGCPKTW